MNLIKKLFFVFVLISGLIMSNYSVFALDLSGAKGKTLYTKVNMWFESKGRQPIKIPSTNCHKTTLIPVGSKVKIDDYNSDSLLFTVEKLNMQFSYVIIAKHTQESISEMFTRLFSETEVLGFGKEYTMFSGKEKENIKNGTITIGMSKASVIMAYGYPPSHMTPTKDMDVWTYWGNRFRKEEVVFKDNKVSSIIR